MNVDLPPHIKHWVGASAQFRSPDLQVFGGQFVEERVYRPTKIDVIPSSTKAEVIESLRDCRTWYGDQWDYQNRDRRLDRARSQGQVYYGLAVERLSYEMPGEPDIKETDPKKALKAREDYFMDKEVRPFSVDPVHPLSVEFAPIHKPTFFREETVSTLYSARDLRNGAGKYVDVSQDRVITFRGDEEPLQEWNDRAAMEGTTLHHITQAWKDQKNGQWMIAEYICIGSGGSNSEPDFTNAEVLREPDVVPFNACPYEVIPSGEYDMFASDPHFAFVARMESLYVDIMDLNQVETELWAYAIREGNALAVTLDGPNPELLWDWLESRFGQAEGDGAQRGMIIPIPNNGPGELPVVPRIVKMPYEVGPTLLERRRAIYERIKEHKPNRFQTGYIGKTEGAEMKATTNANATEASGLPIEADLGEQDSATRSLLEKMRAAILYWPENKIYPWASTGSLPLGTTIDGYAWGNPAMGENGSITAAKMKATHKIIAWTKNQTQAEEQIEALMAFQDEAQGVSTHAQTIARRGYDDVQKQIELLEQDRVEKDIDPHHRQLMAATAQAIYDGLTGANTGALLGLPPAMAPQLPGAPAFPGLNEQTVPRSGSGTPSWKPQFMAETQTTPGGAALQPGHGIAPSPTEFGQGSSPSGNGMAGR